MIFASADFGESYILEIVAFIIVAWFIIKKFPGPMLGKGMRAKVESIRSQLAAGDEARTATQQLLAQRQSEVETAKQEAKAIVSQAQDGSRQLIAEGQRRADAEYERLVSHAAVQAELEQNRMRVELMNELSSMVVIGADQVVDAELDPRGHRRLIDESIGAVESEATS